MLTIEDINPVIAYSDDYLVGRQGEITIGYKIELPPIFTFDDSEYDKFIEHFTNGIKSLPDYVKIHRQDIISTYMTYFDSHSDYFMNELQKCHAKPRLIQESYLYFTLFTEKTFKTSIKKGLSFNIFENNISEKDITAFIDSVEQFIVYITSVKNHNDEKQSSYIKARKIPPSEFTSENGPISKSLFLNNDYFSDIAFDNGDLKVGENHIEIFSLTDNTSMPSEIDSTKVFDRYELPIAWGSCMTILNFPHIVNTYIFKGNNDNEIKKLRSKRQQMSAFRRTSRDNEIAMEQIDTFLEHVLQNNTNIVDIHINIILWDASRKGLALKSKTVKNELQKIGCNNVKKEELNKLNLFIGSLPGNSANIFQEFSFKVIAEIASICINYISINYPELFDNGILYTDRLSGSPIRIDPSEPYNLYDFNKNKFVLGGSGGGKSFWMNYYIHSSLLEHEYHVVIVDIGRSYIGLKEVTPNAKIFEYTETQPLSFNPFIITTNDLADGSVKSEKLMCLKTIIKTLWKGSGYEITQTESVVLDNIIHEYYSIERSTYNFDSFYACIEEYSFNEDIGFNKAELLNNLEPYKSSGTNGYLLNAPIKDSLLDDKLIIFELDNIRGNPTLLSIVTAVITDIFISKMRNLPATTRKMIVFEEAWAALSNTEMANVIQWLMKTGRKFNTETIIVTQELDDILASSISSTIIGNCSAKILLDLSAFKQNFEHIAKILGLTEFQQQQVKSLNKGKIAGQRSKDFFISYQYGKSYIAETFVSFAQALLYTSIMEEKEAIKYVTDEYKISYVDAIKLIVTHYETIQSKANKGYSLKESIIKTLCT